MVFPDRRRERDVWSSIGLIISTEGERGRREAREREMFGLQQALEIISMDSHQRERKQERDSDLSLCACDIRLGGGGVVQSARLLARGHGEGRACAAVDAAIVYTNPAYWSGRMCVCGWYAVCIGREREKCWSTLASENGGGNGEAI